MSVDYTPRLGLPRWGAGTDPFTRAQMNAAHQQLDDFAGIDVQVDTVGNRPPASIGRGVYCAVMDSGAVFRSDGATWHAVSASSVALATSPPGAESFGVAGAVGTSNALARADHRHAMPAHDGPQHANVPISALAAPTGALAMGGHRITNIGAPTISSDAASKAYVDDKAASLTWGSWGAVPVVSNPLWYWSVETRTLLNGRVRQFRISGNSLGYSVSNSSSAEVAVSLPYPVGKFALGSGKVSGSSEVANWKFLTDDNRILFYWGGRTAVYSMSQFVATICLEV